MLGIDRQRVERAQGGSVEAPCVVAVQDHFRLRVVCRQRVERPLGQFFEMGSGRRSRRFASLGVDAGQAKKKTDRQYKVFEHSVGFRTKAKVRNIFYFRPRALLGGDTACGSKRTTVSPPLCHLARFETKCLRMRIFGTQWKRAGSCLSQTTVGQGGCRWKAWPVCGGADPGRKTESVVACAAVRDVFWEFDGIPSPSKGGEGNGNGKKRSRTRLGALRRRTGKRVYDPFVGMAFLYESVRYAADRFSGRSRCENKRAPTVSVGTPSR